jgi:hypothetical protein
MEARSAAVETRSVAIRPRSAAMEPRSAAIGTRPATMEACATAGKTSAGRGKMPGSARARREWTSAPPVTRLNGLQHRNAHDRHTAEYSNNFHNPILRARSLKKQASWSIRRTGRFRPS